jgi:hypothetical protein
MLIAVVSTPRSQALARVLPDLLVVILNVLGIAEKKISQYQVNYFNFGKSMICKVLAFDR